MSTISRSCLMLVVIVALLVGCSTPTPTAIPTEQPTSTPVPSTATAIPTNTPLPPTDTPAPTATPRPTNTPAPTATPRPTNTPQPSPTKLVTPKPTTTKSAAVSTGGGVSSQPSTLANSIEQSFNTAQSIIGVVDQMNGGGGVELCTSLIGQYQSLHNAPTYDMNGQSSEMQQAYSLYRQAIASADTRADTILACGQSGTLLGKGDLSAIRFLVSAAGNTLGQARDWVQRAVNVSSGSPLVDSVARIRTAITQISLSFQRILVGQDEPCGPFVNEYNVLLNAPTYDVSAQSANVQNAYGLYRQGIELALSKASPVAEVCSKGGGNIGKLDVTTAAPVLKQAESALNQALSLLGQ